MKHLFYIFLSFTLFCAISTKSQAQEYIAFPTEEAQWNGLNWYYVPNEMNETWNYTYIQDGDTTINNTLYHKIYYNSETNANIYYIGAIREGENQQIFFFPSEENLNTDAFHQFPNNTEEHLLYSFNNLEEGSTIEINNITIHIYTIDSVLLNNKYHKRYHLSGGTMLGEEHWIEGIGSDKDFLSVYSRWRV